MDYPDVIRVVTVVVSTLVSLALIRLMWIRWGRQMHDGYAARVVLTLSLVGFMVLVIVGRYVTFAGPMTWRDWAVLGPTVLAAIGTIMQFKHNQR